MIEERPQLMNFGRRGADLLLRVGDIFAVLPAARIRTVGTGEECQRPAHTAAAHFGQRVGQQRMPIAIAPINRQRRAVGGQLRFERGDECPILVVDRTATAEVIIVLGHGKHPLGGTFLPRSTFSKNGNTCSGASGPPNETINTAS